VKEVLPHRCLFFRALLEKAIAGDYDKVNYFEAARTMRKFLFVALALLLLSSCTTVIRKDLLDSGTRDFSLQELTRNPEQYKGKRFILGGTVARTTRTEEGSLVDALYVSVDSSGYLRNMQPDGRFLALFPKEMGMLDPALYTSNRHITLAGIFTGVQPSRIGEMGYLFPEFRVEQIYLWPRSRYNPYYHWGPEWGPPWGPPWSPYGGYPYYY
jgi:outer membrane lipoprotein